MTPSSSSGLIGRMLAGLMLAGALRAAEPTPQPAPATDAAATAPAAGAPVSTALDPAAHAGPVRVACLGDSITYGVGAEPGWAWPDQLDRMLGAGWDARGYGQSGATVSKGDKHTIWNTAQYWDALDFHPDVAVILLGTNDSKPENWDARAFPVLYRDLVASFQGLSSGPRVLCGLPPYVAGKGNFGINEPVVLDELPLITHVAGELGAGVVDVHGALQGHDEVFADNVHPRTAGATLIAAAVYRALTGKDWSGPVPPPTQRKDRPLVRVVADPGALTYREAFALIATARMDPGQLTAIRERVETVGPELDARSAELEAQIASDDHERMRAKHSDPAQAGALKAKVRLAKAELDKLRADRLAELIALVPEGARADFGAGWLQRYVLDRCAPVRASLSDAQRAAIRALCAQRGADFGAITNTPERALARSECWAAVYATALDAQQRRRVEPR